MKKIALFSMLTFSVLSLSLAGCGNKKTASTNDSKPKQETKKATQKSSSQQEMKLMVLHYLMQPLQQR